MRQQEALPIWLRPETWLIMQSRTVGLILEKVAPKQKRAIFQRKKKVKPKPHISKTNPINPGDTPHTRTTQIINHIPHPRVNKRLPWLLIIHPPITRHMLYKDTYLLQTTNQALQEPTTL